jgi:hypothetical protein
MGFGSSGYTITLGGGALLAGARATGTIAIPGARASMHVKVTPQSDPGAGSAYGGFVSANDVVTVWFGVILAVTPPSTVFNVTVES